MMRDAPIAELLTTAKSSSSALAAAAFAVAGVVAVLKACDVDRRPLRRMSLLISDTLFAWPFMGVVRRTLTATHRRLANALRRNVVERMTRLHPILDGDGVDTGSAVTILTALFALLLSWGALLR